MIAKLEKPHPDFPLFPHRAGQWCKKIGGKPVYFGSVKKDPEGKAALAKYHDRIAGRPSKVEGLEIGDLCNRFLTAKDVQVENGELAQRSRDNYKYATDMLVRFFGRGRVVETLRVIDFEDLRASISKDRGLVSVGNLVRDIRIVFRYGYESDLLDRPVKFGTAFKKPRQVVIKQEREARGSMMFEAAEIRQLLAKADPQMRAMILLGINCGFGNGDCGELPLSAIDSLKGWVRFPRPKTGVSRRCPLWPETLDAIRDALKARPKPKVAAAEGLVFVTRFGNSWAKETADNPISKAFTKLLIETGLRRSRVGFYGLRRAFETIGGDSLDQVATDFIMGHAPDSKNMGAIYRQRIEDARLQKVVDHVHTWLFPPEKPKPKKGNRIKAVKAKA